MKIHKSLFILLLCFALVCSCNKKNQDNGYGVSISAPKLVGTPAEAFSADDINTLKMTNSFNFLLLNQADTLSSFSFSPISISKYIFELKDKNYSQSFCKKFSIQDVNMLFESINSIKDIIGSIDSTIEIESQEHFTQDSTLVISQKFNFPLMYKDALHTSHKMFKSPVLSTEKKNDLRKKKKEKENQKQLEFFTLNNTFSSYDNEDISVCDIPIGNGNYSLMLIGVKKTDIFAFAKTFTEKDFKNIIDNLKDQNIQVSFPNLTQKTSSIFSLPQLTFDSAYKTPSIIIHSKVRILKPLEEEIKVLSSDEGDQNTIEQTLQSYLFNKPFMFLIRGKSSNSVILSGIFCGF